MSIGKCGSDCSLCSQSCAACDGIFKQWERKPKYNINFSYFKPYFDDRTVTNIIGGLALCVYQGGFSYWNAPNDPTIDTTNQTATFGGNLNVTYKAGIPIEYVMFGV